MRLLYFLLLMVLPSVIFAQSNYHEGYIVKNNGDTLKGFIDYREWARSPVSIDFKINKTDKDIQQFTPAKTKGFGIDSLETYISYNGLVSNDLNHFPNLAENLDTSRVQAGIFLKLVTSGAHLSLYSQADEKKTRYFVSEDSSVPIELKYNQYYNDQHDAIERPFYRGQLLFYINKYIPGNTNLISQAEVAAFEDDQLARIVYTINGDTVVKINGHVKPSNFRGFVGVGLAHSQTKNTTTSGGSVSAFPQFIIGVDKFDNTNVQQLILRVSLSISSVSDQVAYPLSGSPDNIFKFDQFTVAVIPQVIYNVYNEDNFKAYIGAGAGLNFSSYSNPEFTKPSTTETFPTDPTSIYLSSFWVSIPLEAGVMIHKRWDVSFIYTPYAKIAPSSNIGNHSIGLGLKFLLPGN